MIIFPYSECSNFAKQGYRISYGLTRTVRSARSAAECEDICLRETNFVCRAFSFKVEGNSPSYQHNDNNNCELSDRDFRDLSYRDLDQDRDWDVFERTRYSGECRDNSGGAGGGGGGGIDDFIIVDRLSCYRKYRNDASFNARAIVETRSVRDAEECARECDYYRTAGRYQCHAFSVLNSLGRDNCVLTDSYGRDFDSDLVYDRDYSVYEFSGENSQSCRSLSDDGLTQAGEYTVTGQRCLYGGCKLNPDVQYWYCQTEEDGTWDYCCRPQERCGYSQTYK